jgi:hypothetical protein
MAGNRFHPAHPHPATAYNSKSQFISHSLSTFPTFHIKTRKQGASSIIACRLIAVEIDKVIDIFVFSIFGGSSRCFSLLAYVVRS